LLHDDRAVLGAEQRAGRTHVETRGMRAVLADVGRHEPAQRITILVVSARRLALFDECNVSPRVRAERRRVVVRLPGPDQSVFRDHVPFFARDLAGLAADADRRVGEEAYARLLFIAVGPDDVLERREVAHGRASRT